MSKEHKDNLRYIYLGRQKGESTHSGVTCVGYAVYNDDDKCKIAASFAFCSPNDKFSRKKARKIITGRFKSGNIESIKVSPDEKFDEERGPKYEVVVNSIRETLNDAVPNTHTSIGEYMKEYKDHDAIKVGNVKLPWWFDGV